MQTNGELPLQLSGNPLPDRRGRDLGDDRSRSELDDCVVGVLEDRWVRALDP